MDRPTEDPNERTPLSNNGPTKPLPRRRIFIRKFLFIALVFAVAMTLMTTLGNMGRVGLEVSSIQFPSLFDHPMDAFLNSRTNCNA
jgi:hypothetical protein